MIVGIWCDEKIQSLENVGGMSCSSSFIKWPWAGHILTLDSSLQLQNEIVD